MSMKKMTAWGLTADLLVFSLFGGSGAAENIGFRKDCEAAEAVTETLAETPAGALSDNSVDTSAETSAETLAETSTDISDERLSGRTDEADAGTEDEIEKVIHISSVEDLSKLAEKCILDSWSRDVRVVLDQDVDVAGSAFTFIPCFSGVFDGCGHRITGLTFTERGSHIGLFRYLTEGAVVRDLTVAGHIRPGVSSTYVGGIAGRNDGMIVRCSVDGKIACEENAGGIAGENTLTGVISDCTFLGQILGAHAVGGMAGLNEGKILGCRNAGEVNTSPDVPMADTQLNLTGDLASVLENYDISSVSNEDFVDIMDVGGIAGYSDGLIDNCLNSGTVGYARIGYNVGGIAGRTKGYISRSVNEGDVLGRKDTGGIAGQIEPLTIWDYSSEQMNDLLGQLKQLDSLLTGMVDDTSLGIGATRDHITAAETATSETVKQLENLVGVAGDEVTGQAKNMKNLLASLADAVKEENAKGIADGLSQLYELLKNTDLSSQGIRFRVKGDMTSDVNSSLNAQSSSMSSILSQLSAQIGRAAAGNRNAGETVRIVTTSGDAGQDSTDPAGVVIDPTAVDSAAEDPLTEDPGAGVTGDPAAGTQTGSFVDPSAGTGAGSDADPIAPGEEWSVADGVSDDGLIVDDVSGENAAGEDTLTWGAGGNGMAGDVGGDVMAGGSVSQGDLIEEDVLLNGDGPEMDGTGSAAEDPDGEYRDIVLELPQVNAEPEPMDLYTDTIEGEQLQEGDGAETAPPDFASETAELSDESAEGSAADAGNTDEQVQVHTGAADDLTLDGMTNADASGDLTLSGTTNAGVDGTVSVTPEMDDLPDVDQIIALMEQILSSSSTLLDADSLKQAKEILDSLSFEAPDTEPFFTSFENMLVALKPLDNDIAATAATFSSDFKAVMNQVDAIYDTLFGYIESISLDDLPDDMETEEVTDPWQSNQAAVSGCRNLAAVSADTNAGGIIGTAEHEDLIDAEDLVDVSQYILKDVRRMIFASVRSCNNAGAVTAKKEAAGGIAGSVRFGIVAGCTSAGRIEVQEGNYCGGIAGSSDGKVLLCQSANLLSGQSYVGGTAGKAAFVQRCISYSQVNAAGEYIGAIAGMSEGGVEENYYLDRGLGGVDSVSFHGETDPFDKTDVAAWQSAGEMKPGASGSDRQDRSEAEAAMTQISADEAALAMTSAAGALAGDASADEAAGTEEGLNLFNTVTFKVGDTIVEQQKVPFGGGIDHLPQIENDGEDYWVWDEFDQDAVFSDITVEGSYHHPTQTLSAEGNPPKFLVEGTFYEGQELEITSYDMPTEKKPEEESESDMTSALQSTRGSNSTSEQAPDGTSEQETAAGEKYTVRVTGYDGELTVHMREEDEGTLYGVNEGEETEIAFERDGSYLVFPLRNGGTFLYRKADRSRRVKVAGSAVLPAVGGAGAVLAAVLFVVLKKKRKKS